MTVDPAHAAATVEHDGKTYYFLRRAALKSSVPSRSAYLAGQPPREAMSPIPPGAKVEYICPMDPEVLSDHPGPCPICGMALEPRTVTAEDRPSADEELLVRRFYVSLALTLPLLVLAMGPMIPGLALAPRLRLLLFVQFALATPVVLWCGWPFFERALASVVHAAPICSRSSPWASERPTSTARRRPSSRRSSRRVSVIRAAWWTPTSSRPPPLPYWCLLGQVLEARSPQNVARRFAVCSGWSPRTAHRRPRRQRTGCAAGTGAARRRAARAAWRQGARRCAVTEGRSSVDESMISGEPIPVEKEAGGGHRRHGQRLGHAADACRARRLRHTAVQIVRLVGEAQRSRAPVQRLVDRVGRYFVPAVGGGKRADVLWSGAAWGPPPRLAQPWVNAVAVLIIACPCALGLATPMAITVGLDGGRRVVC